MTEARDIHDVLRKHWGHGSFRPQQEPVIRAVLAGRDTLALLPTGAGKSLCFQVPTLAMDRLCLVVSPLIALMKDQVARLKERGIPAVAITSGMWREEIENALESCAAGKRAFLYVSPERLGTELVKARLGRLPIGLIAVDEAHCISQWGYDFRPAYLRIREVRDMLPGVPVLALTASATPRVAEDIMQRLGFAERHVVRSSFHRPEITYWASASEDKIGRLLHLTRRIDGTGIVYVRDRRGTVQIARILEQHGARAAAYHAGMDMKERDRVQRAWGTGEVRFVVATTAFGMGIDKGDVRAVVHMAPPPDLESYYQEAGRAGRDGQRSYAVLLHGAGDAQRMRDHVTSAFPPINDVRRVYQAFADMHRIALGSGEHETYPLDLRAIAQRLDLKPVVIANALKALELDGSIALSEGVRDPSRVMVTAPQEVVYGMRVRDERLGPLLEALLRMYGGLFEEPVMIEEERLSQQMKWSVDRTTGGLQELHRLGVLMYRPRHEGPAVTLLTPRRDAQRLMLEPEALKAREQRALDRLSAMLHFLGSEVRCREQAMLVYFGESDARPCGRCDACRMHAARHDEDQEHTAHLVHAHDPEEVERLRWEIEEGLAPAGGDKR